METHNMTPNCRTCTALLADSRCLTPEAMAGIEAHAADCPACQEELEMIRMLDTALADGPLENPPSEFADRVMSTLQRQRAGIRAPSPALPGMLVLLAAGVLTLFAGQAGWWALGSRVVERGRNAVALAGTAVHGLYSDIARLGAETGWQLTHSAPSFSGWALATGVVVLATLGLLAMELGSPHPGTARRYTDG